MSNPIEDIINALVASETAETKKSVVYRDLTADRNSNIQTLFDIYDLAVSEPVHAMADVIKEKYGITRMSDELYRFIKTYPVEFHELSRHIEKTEGSVCCVDKAYSRMMAKFKQLVDENLATTPPKGKE